MNCTRCKQDKSQVYVLTQTPAQTWGITDTDLASLPRYENSCEDCLSDIELANMLCNVARFVCLSYLNSKLSPDISHSFAHVLAYLGLRNSAPWRSERPDALKALEGLKGRSPRPLDVNYMMLRDRLRANIARSMYLAAYPDQINSNDLEYVIPGWLNASPITSQLLDDAVQECIGISQEHFV